MIHESLYKKVERLQDLLITVSTGGCEDDNLYRELRRDLLSDSLIGSLLPKFLSENRTLAQFWEYIKHEKSTYLERKKLLWDSFSPILNLIESSISNPGEVVISDKLQKLNQEFIQQEWRKALSRKTADPEGAITSSRTLIETVCKFILDEFNVIYQDDLELPRLYKLTAANLNLAPEQHHEVIFKQILGGCHSVVEGLGSLRNKLSDSHGKHKRTIKPSAKHAELAVNLAGSMTTFLIDSFTERKQKAALVFSEKNMQDRQGVVINS